MAEKEETRKAMEEILKFAKEIAKMRAALAEKEKELTSLLAEVPEVVEEIVTSLQKEKEEIERKIAELEMKKRKAIAEYDKKIEPLKAQLASINVQLAMYTRRKYGRAKVTVVTPKERPPRGFKAAIIELLSSHPGEWFTVKEVHEAVGTSVPGRARTILDELVKEGKVEKDVSERPYKYRWIG